MDTNPQHPHPNYRLFISVIALLAIGIWLTSVYLYKLKQQRDEIPAVPITAVSSPEATTPIATITQGSIELKGNASKVSVGQAVVVTASFDSNKKDVVGYDVLVKYDENALAFVSATSLIPSFTVVPVVKNGLIAVTGSKALLIKSETVFKGTPVVRFTFTAKTKGKRTVSVLPSSGNLKSRFVDAKLEKLYPRTSSVEVEVN